jgi:hypothetical protein
MKRSYRSANEIFDRRQLILARRMATRTRAGAACTSCKARKSKCSDYRPCARCRDLRLGECSTRNSAFDCSYNSTRSHEDGPNNAILGGSLIPSLMTSGFFSSQTQRSLTPATWSWSAKMFGQISAASASVLSNPLLQLTGGMGDFTNEANQVPHLSFRFP